MNLTEDTERRSLAALGEPRDSWEAEMISIARRELDKAAGLESRAEGGDLSQYRFAALIGQADNARGYAEALLYAVRRRREIAPPEPTRDPADHPRAAFLAGWVNELTPQIAALTAERDAAQALLFLMQAELAASARRLEESADTFEQEALESYTGIGGAVQSGQARGLRLGASALSELLTRVQNLQR